MMTNNGKWQIIVNDIKSENWECQTMNNDNGDLKQ